MAGLSFSNSQIGLAHALGHAMGAYFGIPHGKTVGLYLPEVVRYNQRKAGPRYDNLNKLFPKKFISGTLDLTLRNYFREIGQPTQIEDIPIQKSDYESKISDMKDLASQSTGILTNPEEADSTALEMLLRSVI